MHPIKAPGPDGLPPLFFQQFCDIIGGDGVQLVCDTLHGTGSEKRGILVVRYLMASLFH